MDFPKENVEEDTEVIIHLTQKRMKKIARLRNQSLNQGKTFIQDAVGQQVLIKEHKLSSAENKEIKKLFLLYRGPYDVLKVRDNNTVTIKEDEKLVTHNVKSTRTGGRCVNNRW